MDLGAIQTTVNAAGQERVEHNRDSSHWVEKVSYSGAFLPFTGFLRSHTSLLHSGTVHFHSTPEIIHPSLLQYHFPPSCTKTLDSSFCLADNVLTDFCAYVDVYSVISPSEGGGERPGGGVQAAHGKPARRKLHAGMAAPKWQHTV